VFSLLCRLSEFVCEYYTCSIHRRDDCVSKLLRDFIISNILLVKVFQAISSDTRLTGSVRDTCRQQTDNAMRSDSDIDYRLLLHVTTKYKIRLDDVKPVNSGMIAIVFKGTMENGHKVAIKTKRIDIHDRLSRGHRDFVTFYNWMTCLTYPFKQYYDILYNLKSFVDTRDYILSQCSFADEMRTMNIVREDFIDKPEFVIPNVLNFVTADNEFEDDDCIIMDWLEGVRCFDVPEQDKPKTGEQIVRYSTYQLFNNTYIHADLHPGNMICMEGNKIGVIDHGMSILVTDTLRDTMTKAAMAGLNADRHKTREIDMLSVFGSIFSPPLDLTRLDKPTYKKLNDIALQVCIDMYQGVYEEAKMNAALTAFVDGTAAYNSTFSFEMTQMMLSLSMAMSTYTIMFTDVTARSKVMKRILIEALD
jgi:predicted unusual protein kinase regulating ubiquinone biosynthesis (AarF/ABC1/UbiB family)